MRIVNSMFLMPVILFCKSLTVDSKLDKETAYIGDIIKWTIEVKNYDERKYNFPILFDEDELISVINHQIIFSEVHQAPIGIEFELTAWDTGKFMTPSYSIEIMKDDLVDYNFKLDPIEFEIISILNTLEQADFRDIKGPVPVKNIFPFKEIAYCFLLLLLGAVIILIWRNKVEPKYEKINYDFLESPIDRASRRLMEIDSSILAKEYYSMLSHVLREYIETKYYIRTLEMTTEEIENAFEIFKFDEQYLIQVINFLKESDKVKYAREIPNPDKMVMDKEKIQDLINSI